MRTYPAVCPVDGVTHDYQAEFLSGSTRVMEDGTERVVISCGGHTGEELRAAWEEAKK